MALPESGLPAFEELVTAVNELLSPFFQGDIHSVPRDVWEVLGKSLLFIRSILLKSVDARFEANVEDNWEELNKSTKALLKSWLTPNFSRMTVYLRLLSYGLRSTGMF